MDNMRHISVSDNTELGEYMQNLCCLGAVAIHKKKTFFAGERTLC